MHNSFKNSIFVRNSAMEKVIRIVKKGEDNSNIKYWLTLTHLERLSNLEAIRQEVIARFYDGTRQEFQRVYRVVERSWR